MGYRRVDYVYGMGCGNALAFDQEVVEQATRADPATLQDGRFWDLNTRSYSAAVTFEFRREGKVFDPRTFYEEVPARAMRVLFGAAHQLAVQTIAADPGIASLTVVAEKLLGSSISVKTRDVVRRTAPA
ncbi:hypothetical protein HY374_00785 [Candidatus Berkelbacteria bacterium]|nr:hypothetical protein [Candidatus Berkelbacteria bacterium]